MPLHLTLDYDRGVPVYRQIVEAVIASLSSGQLGPDKQLPTIHGLASQLGINPNTVVRAYRELEASGHVVSQRGVGTFPDRRATGHASRRTLLRTIVDRALEEAARYGFSASEVASSLKRSR